MGSSRAASIHADEQVISTEIGVLFLGDARQIETDHRQRRVEPDGARPVEQARQVPGDEAAQRVADLAAVLGESAVRVVGVVGAQQPVDHHRQDRHVRVAHRAGQGGVDRGVLQRRQPPI
ncbi:hypothetical protein JOD60_001055 [Microbacterium aurum]|nr:hypothetical protein [Microbacterium aurum]